MGDENIAGLGAHLDDRRGLDEGPKRRGHAVPFLGKGGVGEDEAAAAQGHRGAEEVAEDEGEAPRNMEQASEQVRSFALDPRDQGPGVEVEALPAQGSRLPAGHHLDVRRHAQEGLAVAMEGRRHRAGRERTSAGNGSDRLAFDHFRSYAENPGGRGPGIDLGGLDHLGRADPREAGGGQLRNEARGPGARVPAPAPGGGHRRRSRYSEASSRRGTGITRRSGRPSGTRTGAPSR